MADTQDPFSLFTRDPQVTPTKVPRLPNPPTTWPTWPTGQNDPQIAVETNTVNGKGDKSNPGFPPLPVTIHPPQTTPYDGLSPDQAWNAYDTNYAQWTSQFGGHPGDANWGLGANNEPTAVSMSMPTAPGFADPRAPRVGVPTGQNQIDDQWATTYDQNTSANPDADAARYAAIVARQRAALPQQQQDANLRSGAQAFMADQARQTAANLRSSQTPSSWEQSSASYDPNGDLIASRGRGSPFDQFQQWRAPLNPGSAGQQYATQQEKATGQRPWWG